MPPLAASSPPASCHANKPISHAIVSFQHGHQKGRSHAALDARPNDRHTGLFRPRGASYSFGGRTRPNKAMSFCLPVGKMVTLNGAVLNS